MFVCLFLFVNKCVFVRATEEVAKSGSLLPLGKNSLLSKIGDQEQVPWIMQIQHNSAIALCLCVCST